MTKETLVPSEYRVSLDLRESLVKWDLKVKMDPWDLKDPKEIGVTWETLGAKVLWVQWE